MAPLSDHEQKILEDIEKNLYAEDPSFAKTVEHRSSRSFEVGRVKMGAAIFAAGFVLLIVFFVSRILLVGIAAFGVMVTGMVMMGTAITSLAPGRRSVSSTRVKLSTAMAQWEERLRDRYKRN